MLLLATTLVMMQAVSGPVFADADSSDHAKQRGAAVPDFDSAVMVESDSDYQITEDGYLIYEGDIVFECQISETRKAAASKRTKNGFVYARRKVFGR